MKQTYIKEFILESNFFSQKQLKEVEDFIFQEQTDFVDALLRLNLLDKKSLSKIFATVSGVAKIDLDQKIVTTESFKQIPELICDKYNIICFHHDKESLSVAFNDIESLEKLEEFLPVNKKLKLFLAEENDILEKKKIYKDLLSLEFSYKNKINLNKILKIDTFGIKSRKELPDEYRFDIANDLYTEKFIEGLLSHAISQRADFIFFNTDGDEVSIFFRIFDRNYKLMEMDKNTLFSISTKLKQYCDINIFDDKILREGSFEFNYFKILHSIFLSFIAADFGESITIQIDKDKQFKTSTLYLTKKQKKFLFRSQRKDSGIILLSGKKKIQKEKTLYSFLEFDLEKFKDIYILSDSVHHLPNTKQISFSRKNNILPLMTKIINSHPDVIAINMMTKGLFPIIFNYVSLSKKVFLSIQKRPNDFMALLLEMDFDKGRIVKNFSLFIESRSFNKLNSNNSKKYHLKKDEIKLLYSFITKKEIEDVFEAEGLISEAKKDISKIDFFTNKKKEDIYQKVELKGIFELGIFLENVFLKKYGKEKIKNIFTKKIKKSVLENGIIASFRNEIDIKDILKYLSE